jgi:hypothetical protein
MPKFQRVSLLGSEELFRPTKVENDAQPEEPLVQEVSPADSFSGRVVPAPISVEPAAGPPPLAQERYVHRLHLTEGQVRTLIDGIQRMKYPGQVRPGHEGKPSIEEFEQLEALRNLLLDALE